MKPHVVERNDFLPGYHPLERLGSGGYGEVWKAEAPGGLIKAVKLIHGYSHEQRASDELKAMERVKQVRHPFLLSLERIETIDNRLFIVTELADQSLRDYFTACVRRGKNGIPRTELLNYLRDAADALDFMSEVHGLQHLDIKPENLLLVAGHIKVADFGLVKDVQRQSISMVGGLTPVYAAPEVFHGRPSRYSDQYSLAVVYQQMLTATLPFDGASAAELTLQHINEEPDLSALSASDRPTIARALSKNPAHRFASCRSMIDALIEGESHAASVNGQSTPAGREAAGRAAEVEYGVTWNRGRDRESQDLENDIPPAVTNVSLNFAMLEPARIATRPVPPFDAQKFQPVPVLLVGIGGAGGSVLRQFKRRIAERFGGGDEVPAFTTLLIDTDSSDLLEATHGGGQDRLSPHETLAAPLRRPQEYRSRHGQPFNWLSRRWLYNVPRSLKTEGLRPLGRLAFVDHSNAIRARLQKALDDVLDPQGIEQSRTITGVPLAADRLRVYVVASICGGTGSGMILDVTYMLHDLIDRRGVECDGFTGIALLRTPDQPRMRELAAVNAFAWLTEFNHFNRPGAAFPGDPSCGLEPREIDERAFRDTYIVHLGHSGRPEEVSGRVADVAEYIYLDAVTPVHEALEACRRAPREEPDADAAHDRAALATFGVAVRDVSRSGEVERVTAELVQKVVLGWLGRRREPAVEELDAPQVEASAEPNSQRPRGNSHPEATLPGAGSAPSRVERVCGKEAEALQMDSRQLLMMAAKLLEMELRATPKAFFQRLVLELRGSRETVDASAVLQAVDRMFGGPPQEEDNPAEAVVLRKPLEAITKPLVEKMEAHLGKWLVGRLDDPELRLAGAVESANWFTAHLRKIGKEVAAQGSQIARDVHERHSTRTALDDSADSHEAVYQYFERRLQLAITGAALFITRSLAAVTGRVQGQLVAAGRNIRELAQKCEPPTQATQAEDGETEAAADETRRKLAQALVAREAAWVSAVNAAVQPKVAGSGGLYRTLCGDVGAREELLADLDDAARRCVRSIVAETKLLDRLLGADDEAGSREVAGLLKQARPECLEYGGAVCHVLAAPHDADLEDVRRRVGAQERDDLGVMKHPENQLVACTEVQDLSLTHLAMSLIRNRRDYASFAHRVLSRKDVPWSPLIAELPPSPAEDPVIQTVVMQ